MGTIDSNNFVKVDKLISFCVSVGVENDMFLSISDIRKMKLEKIYKYEIL